jgi:hypothetical protein
MLRLLIIAVLIYGGYLLQDFLRTEYRKSEEKAGVAVEVAPQTPSPQLPGMPPQLEASLLAAEGRGPATFKKWIEINRKYLSDPKLGDIELDYAVAVVRQNSSEARAYYQGVKERTPASSPLQARLKRLAKTFD